MADLSLPARDSVDAQRELFRRAASEHQLPIAALARLSGISASTLKGWNDGAAMPAWAIGALGAAGVPDELLSLVTSPWSRSVVTDDGGDGCIEGLARETAGFTAEYIDRAADGQICHLDRAALKKRAGRVKAQATRAAA